MSKQRSQGLSLVELMIAMAIGLILMAGIAALMISSKRSYNVQNDLSGLQENARFATDFIGRDLRMAGYFGCAGNIPAGPATIPAPILRIQGTDNNGVNQSDVVLVSFVDTNRNAFAMMHCPSFAEYGSFLGFATQAAYENAAVCPPPTQATFLAAAERTPLVIGTTALPFTSQFTIRGEIFTGDFVVASDCGGNGLYRVQAVSATGITVNPALERTYNNGGQSYGAQLRRLNQHRYYISQRTVQDTETQADKLYLSLCRDNLALAAARNCAEELVEGVENMQVRYGVNLGMGAQPFQYVTANNVVDWSRVESIRITFLMRTLEQRFDQELDTKEDYALDPGLSDNTYDPPDDYRIRRIFTSTINLRNAN